MEEHFCQLTKHSAGNMEDCSRVAKSIAALVECFRLEARKCMAVGALCRKNGLSIFGLGEAERCQLDDRVNRLEDGEQMDIVCLYRWHCECRGHRTSSQERVEVP